MVGATPTATTPSTAAQRRRRGNTWTSGQFRNRAIRAPHQRTDRTAGSELFINPLMAFYWCFRLDQVAKRVLYLKGVAGIEGYVEFGEHIASFQRALRQLRIWKDLPM